VRVLGRLSDFDVALGHGVQSSGTGSDSRLQARRGGVGSLSMRGELETDTGNYMRAQQSEQRYTDNGKLGKHVMRCIDVESMCDIDVYVVVLMYEGGCGRESCG
jgi:hypothetical protein